MTAGLAESSATRGFEPVGGGRSGFLSKAGGRPLHLDPSGLVLELDRPQARERRALRMRLVGARATARLAGAGELAGRRNYFLGTPERWRAGVPQYAAVRLEGIYPGVDLLVRTERDHWEYDFVLAPGASPGAIRLRFEGTSRVAIGSEGDLLLETPAGPVRHSRPRIYQEIGGRRVHVAGRFASREPATIGFRVGSYDRGRPLIIDPASWSPPRGASRASRRSPSRSTPPDRPMSPALFRQMQPPFVRPNPPFIAFRLSALRRAAIMARMLRNARVREVLFFPGKAASRVLPLLFLNPLSDFSALLLVRGLGALVYRSRFLPRVLGVHRCAR